MTHPHEPLSPNRVLPLLRGRFGDPYLWQEACASTQDVLRDPSLPEGAVAVAEHQTSGRGREGRRWEDVPGRSLLLSLLLRPPTGLPAPQLSLVAGLAVAEAVDAIAGTRSCLKWPNDVVVGDRKVAGVLLESVGGAAICGIGINVDQSGSELPRATRLPPGSLRTATGRRHDRAALLAELLTRIESCYETWLRSGLAPLHAELQRRDALCGRGVQFDTRYGRAAGIADDGRLRVRLPDGTIVLLVSGELRVSD